MYVYKNNNNNIKLNVYIYLLRLVCSSCSSFVVIPCIRNTGEKFSVCVLTHLWTLVLDNYNFLWALNR